MEDYSADAVVNRDEPIPVIGEPNDDSAPRSKRDSWFGRLSFDRQREQQETLASHGQASIQDRLFSKILQQVIPADIDDGDVSTGDGHPHGKTKRPDFSLPVMGNNFRRFNARIGIVFVFQNRVERLLSWRKPTHTLSFLCLYSFVCLDPYLLIILPIAVVLLFIMVPAFLARHPPPPSNSTSSTTPYYSYEGPALAPAKTIKPASETSKDFLRNMRDLQNSMADFANGHDAVVSLVAPATNFSDEKFSSTLFLVLYVIMAVLFLTAHHLPLRFILLIGGNAGIVANHPGVQEFIRQCMESIKEEQPDDGQDNKGSEKSVVSGAPSSPPALISSLNNIVDISLDSSPEEREVEIFELQYRPLSLYSSSPEWEHVLFSPTPYDPLSPSRIAGDRPRGCRFFEDVQPPTGWAWKNKKWELDLDCREWVVERMVTGVGFEAPDENFGIAGTSEEVGGWVWDLASASDLPDTETDLNSAIYGSSKDPSTASRPDRKAKQGSKDKGKAASRDWEEVVSHGVGEWRRRRWVRIVQRVGVPTVDKDRDTDTDRD
ncbi:Peroxisome size and maintenance regulator [Paecilomyces lecythidis]